MSRKTNSVGLRLNTKNKNYNNCWYSDYSFSYNFTQSLCIENSQKDAFKALNVLLPKMSYIGAYKKATLCCCYLDKNKLLGYKGSYTTATKIFKTAPKKENMWHKDIQKKSYQREHLKFIKDTHNSSFNCPETYSGKLLEMLFSNSRDKTLKSFTYKNSLFSSALKKGIYNYFTWPFQERTISAESTGDKTYVSEKKERKTTTLKLFDEGRKHTKSLEQKIDGNVKQGFKTYNLKDYLVKNLPKNQEVFFKDRRVTLKAIKEVIKISSQSGINPIFLEKNVLVGKELFIPRIKDLSIQGSKSLASLMQNPESLNILKISGSRGALDRQSTAFLLDFYKRNFYPWALGYNTKEKKQNSIEFEKSSRTLYKNKVLDETPSKGFISSFLKQKLFLKSSDIGKNYRFHLKGRSLYNNQKTSKDLETSLYRFLSFVSILGYIFCVAETSKQKIFGPSILLKASGEIPSLLGPSSSAFLELGSSQALDQRSKIQDLRSKPLGPLGLGYKDQRSKILDLRSLIQNPKDFASANVPKSSCFNEIKISKIPEKLKSTNQQPEVSKILEEKLKKYKQKTSICYVKNSVSGFSRFWGNPVSLFLYKSRNEKACSLFLADYISYFLQRKVLFRRITSMLNFSKKNSSGSYRSKNPNNFSPFISKIKGCRISCSGRVGGRSKKAQRSRTEKFMWGETGLNVFSNKIDFAKTIAETRFGIVGIKVWVCYK